MTGGTGFLGGWLVRALLRAGAEVVALVRDEVPQSMIEREGLLARIIRVHGCVGDLALLRRAMCEYSVDTVFHLAAQALVGVAKLDPVGTLDVNVRGAWNLLEAARQAGVRQIVVASSDKAYGCAERLPNAESDPLQGKYPYDVSKSCADLICGMYAATYSLPVAVLRCANLFGGGDLNFSRLIPGVVRSALFGEKFLIRSDGRFVRDFLYVRDAAAGYLLVAESLAANRSLTGEAFNLSLGVRITVLEVVRKALELMGRADLEPIVQNQASSEIREQYLAADKARRLLGWSPRYSLEEGLQETIDWYREYFGVAGRRETDPAASASVARSDS